MYIHHINPSFFYIRFYGLAYVLSLFLCYYLLRRFIFVGKFSNLATQVDSFLFFGFFSMLIGGRLGYFLFYLIPDYGWQIISSNPFLIFKVWEGGMSFHGGVLGVFFSVCFFSLRTNINWRVWGDAICSVAPLGIFFVRIANFINGELYGKITEVPWAMKFPLELATSHLLFQQALLISLPFDSLLSMESSFSEFLIRIRENEAVREAISPFLSSRHPSQLYEAFLEGFCLFLLSFFIFRKRFLGTGFITAFFFLFYGFARIFAEMFREPDSALIFFLSKGQFYSCLMLLVGILLLFFLAPRNK